MGSTRAVRLLITGSQTWVDEERIRHILGGLGFNPAATTLVSGGCPKGADMMCENAALDLGWHVELHHADWTRFGKRAGYIRNAEMVNLGADMCLAFIMNNSPGASMTAELAENAGIKTYIFADTTEE